jgi:glycine/D-amino acid oxidase-like deaminating enzyme
VSGDTVKLGLARDQEAAEPVADPSCPPGFPREVLARAATLIPGLGRYLDEPPEMVAHDGGFYARTPDGLPVVGPLGAAGGFVVGGLAGFGAMMACGVGELAASWALGEALPELAAAFDPRRFDEPGRPTGRPAGGPPAGEL